MRRNQRRRQFFHQKYRSSHVRGRVPNVLSKGQIRREEESVEESDQASSLRTYQVSFDSSQRDSAGASRKFVRTITFELTRIRTRGSFSRTFTTLRQSTCCASLVSVSKKFSATRVPRKRPLSKTSVSVSSRCFEHPAPLGDTFGPFFDSSTSGCQTESDQAG